MATERNVGIELLRIVAMLMIVFLHITGYVFCKSDVINLNLLVRNYFNAISICSVNIYAIITGWFFVRSSYNNSQHIEIHINKIFLLWLQVLFYSVGIAIVFMLSGLEKSLTFDWKYLTPVYHDLYWYITAFFGMFALRPLIEYTVSTVKLQQLCKILFLILLLYSILPMILKNRNVFHLNHGFSALWLIVCACIGGILRRIHDSKILNYKMLLYLFGGINLILFLFILIKTYYVKMAFISLTFNCYIAPIAVFNGMILVSVFSKITIQKQWINKIILQLSPLTLGIYLIHIHPLIWRKYFQSKAYAVNIRASLFIRG